MLDAAKQVVVAGQRFVNNGGTVIQVVRQQYIHTVAVEPVGVIALPGEFDAEQGGMPLFLGQKLAEIADDVLFDIVQILYS